MKLTVAQKKALQAVADGTVTYYERYRINSTGKSIFGYRKGVIERLTKDGLITLPRCEAGKHTKYILTPAGSAALEEAQCKS